ncbi:hypothetical protein JOC95_001994 [Bacillus tianshenii]|uniref:Uncharacterized protein n=1 Tax=Sutcliffiella tianshenii TaxID=1463404 RepID=A0ABS2NZL2_9BACI|nr:hypothetical protein [Bacillus tianshenii]
MIDVKPIPFDEGLAFSVCAILLSGKKRGESYRASGEKVRGTVRKE